MPDPACSRRDLLGGAGATLCTAIAAGAGQPSQSRPRPEAPDAFHEPSSRASAQDLRAVTRLMEAKWPQNRAIHIVCHGHSVPAGYFKTPVVDTFNAYPHLLHRGLKGRYPHAVINVIVTAIGGEHAESGAQRFKGAVLIHRPDVLTIDYSLNDRRLGLERARAAWARMIEPAMESGIQVILLTPTADTSARLDSPDDPLIQHAAQVRELANRYGVALADSLAAFQRRIAAGTPLESLMSQANHPNRQGHELVAQELLALFPQAA